MISTVIGVITLLAGLLAWLGQSLAFVAPTAAVKLGVLEPEEEIDPTLYVVETYAMGLSDLLLAWTLPVSALLMLVGHAAWPYLALFGSGVYVYFSAVTMLSRVYLKSRGKKVGRVTSVRAAYVFGVIWVACSVAMTVAAVTHLSRG